MHGRRRLLILVACLAVLVVGVGVALAVRLSPPGPPTRPAGDLEAAVAAWKGHDSTPARIIATDPAHRAVVGAQSVTWFDGTGSHFRTPLTAPAEASRLFLDSGFTNWRDDAPEGTSGSDWARTAVILVIAALALLVLKRQNMIPGARRRRRQAIDEAPATRFADVAGCDAARAELEEVVAYLRTPERFVALGARVPRGVLLVGPPGTGKTLLARAVAGEAGVPFFNVSGSEFVEMFVGVGAGRVRDLFATARKRGPSIVFLDEIDAIGGARGRGRSGGHEEREQTLNQLLVEMDGFADGPPVVVLAATNRADTLDPALLRPGRFDRHVSVDLPDLSGREAVLRVHAQGKPMDSTVDLRTMARETTGMSGADLANLLNEAALVAARRERSSIDTACLEEAVARVIAGPERGRVLSPREREIIAWHEMGHALVFHTLEDADPVHRVSIVARGRALGWTLTLPEDDRVLATRTQVLDRMAGTLGGRAAEEILLGPAGVTSGAADDLQRVTGLAHRMVSEWGMSDRGMRVLREGDTPYRPWSEEWAAAADAEVDRIVEEAADRARRVLRDRLPLLRALSERLLDVETIEVEEFRHLVRGHRTVAPPPAAAPVLPLPVTRRRTVDVAPLPHRRAGRPLVGRVAAMVSAVLSARLVD